MKANKDNVEVITPAPSAMTDETSAKALAVAAKDAVAKKSDAMNLFLADLNKAQAADVRKETTAFITEIREAAGKVASAIVHLHNVRNLLADAALYDKYCRALVAEGYVSAGTLYTLTKKIEVFEQLNLAMPARKAIMAYSQGDSVIVRRNLTPAEIEAHKKAHPGTKVPKGTYEPSKYFVRAVEVVTPPAKWTETTADSYAGQVIRLASSLRGKDRSGAQPPGQAGDSRKVEQFESLLDKLEVKLIGKSIDGTLTGMVTLADAERQNQMFADAAECVIAAVCKRLPLSALNTLYETIDEIFTQSIEKMQEAEKPGKAGKLAKTA